MVGIYVQRVHEDACKHLPCGGGEKEGETTSFFQTKFTRSFVTHRMRTKEFYCPSAVIAVNCHTVANGKPAPPLKEEEGGAEGEL